MGGSTEVAGQDWLWLEGLHSAQDWEALLNVPMGLDPVLPAVAWGLQGLIHDGLDVGAPALTGGRLG